MEIGVGVHIYEAGTNDSSIGLDGSFCIPSAQLSDLDNAITANTDVSPEPGISCAVNNTAMQN